jgi:hypothetical protein
MSEITLKDKITAEVKRIGADENILANRLYVMEYVEAIENGPSLEPLGLRDGWRKIAG